MSEDETWDEEIVVGRHESGIILEEGMNTGFRNYCSKCKNNIHSHVEVENGKAEIIFTCTNNACECRCRTHFACKRCGYLHPYGVKCTRVVEEPKRNTAADENFNELMENWRESKDTKPSNIQVKSQ